MAGQVFRVMLRMEIAPGSEEAFEREWAAGATDIAAEQANIRQWLSRDTEQTSIYYIVSDWVDEESFRAYERTQRHREHRERLHPFRLRGSMTASRVQCELAGVGAVTR